MKIKTDHRKWNQAFVTKENMRQEEIQKLIYPFV